MRILIEIEYNPARLSFARALSLLKRMGFALRVVKMHQKKYHAAPKNVLSMAYISHIVGRELYLTEADICLQTRRREIVEARQIAMWFSKHFTKETLQSIGNKFGGKDHATVLHACKTVNDLADTNAKFRTRFINIGKALNINILQ